AQKRLNSDYLDIMMIAFSGVSDMSRGEDERLRPGEGDKAQLVKPSDAGEFTRLFSHATPAAETKDPLPEPCNEIPLAVEPSPTEPGNFTRYFSKSSLEQDSAHQNSTQLHAPQTNRLDATEIDKHSAQGLGLSRFFVRASSTTNPLVAQDSKES